MKAIPALLSASIALLMVSCTSPIVKRIERNPDLYAALSPRHKDLVLQGRIEEGMTKKAVFLSWGKPDRAAIGSRNGREFEKWSYAGYEPTYSTGLGFGTSFGHHHGHGHCGGLYGTSFFYEPMMTYVPYEAARVEFVKGIVTAWSASH